MKTKALIRSFAFAALIVAVSLACRFGGDTSTPIPVQQLPPPQQQQQQPTPQPQQPVAPTPEPQQQSSGGLTTFTDENNYYQIDVPSDWTYNHEIGTYYYIDQFKSPDEQALVENLLYDEGNAFTGNVNGRFALALLHTFYSATGKEGDIRITDDNIQPDGSERLIWESKSGGYSGISYFEVRGSTTFLMFTIEWVNSAKGLYLDTLNQVVASYK